LVAIYTGIKLAGPNTNAKVKQVIILRMFLLAIVFSLCNLTVVFSTVVERYPHWDPPKSVWNLFYVEACQGTLFFLVRIIEPYCFDAYKKTFLDLVYFRPCRRSKSIDNDSEQDQKQAKGTLMIFLSS